MIKLCVTHNQHMQVAEARKILAANPIKHNPQDNQETNNITLTLQLKGLKKDPPNPWAITFTKLSSTLATLRYNVYG